MLYKTAENQPAENLNLKVHIKNGRQLMDYRGACGKFFKMLIFTPRLNTEQALVIQGLAGEASRPWGEVSGVWGKQSTTTFPGDSVVKNPPANEGDSGSIPGLGRSPAEGNGNPLQDSCLESPVDRGAWWATVHGITKSQTRLSMLTGITDISKFS